MVDMHLESKVHFQKNISFLNLFKLQKNNLTRNLNKNKMSDCYVDFITTDFDHRFNELSSELIQNLSC
jgi:hypothetical protein